MKTSHKLYILGIGILSGLLLMWQSESLEIAGDSFGREAETTVFQEIKILKEKNDDLRKEVSELEDSLGQLKSQDSALDALSEEINKYKKLSGSYPIYGPGISIRINASINTTWAIDLINELHNSGAEAVSLNDIRITNANAGFDTLPKGQILLNGSILNSPYDFKVIGEPSQLIKILELPGGLFDRLEAAFPGSTIQSERKEIIQMI